MLNQLLHKYPDYLEKNTKWKKLSLSQLFYLIKKMNKWEKEYYLLMESATDIPDRRYFESEWSIYYKSKRTILKHYTKQKQLEEEKNIIPLILFTSIVFLSVIFNLIHI